MPSLVGWENKSKTIVRHELIGDWNLEEYIASAKATQSFTASMPHMVHVIIDFTQSKSYPARFLDAMTSVERNLPANQGLVVMVRHPRAMEPVLGIARVLYPRLAKNLFYADSLDEALAIITAHEAESQT